MIQQGLLPANFPYLFIDKDSDWKKCSTPIKYQQTTSDDIAFIGYSSGTTGTPKGVAVTHKSAIYSFCHFWKEIWNLPERNQYGYATYLSWDAMGPLLFGATGNIIPDYSDSPRALLNYMHRKGINHSFFTPSLLKSIIQEIPSNEIKKKLARLKILWLGGEILTRDLLKKIYDLLPNITIVNNYGPSECFVVSQGILKKEDANLKQLFSPTGRILPDMQVLLLNKKYKEVNAGETGELFVAGPCLADGYLNNSKMTKEKFLNLNGQIYFKTGDFANYMYDGRLVIEGRSNFIFYRGSSKINLTQVQQIINKFHSFKDCVLLNISEDKNRLVCFFVKENNMKKKADQNYKKILKNKLPKHLIPDQFIELNKIPINKNSQKADYIQLKKIINNCIVNNK
jgi:acyl-coenzyme A synthetase/AMP-(fatty) acid ligase